MKTVFDPQNHEIPQIERSIRRLERDLLRMGALVEQSFRLSHQALFAGDLIAAEQIPKLDKKIDRFYRQIESDCTTIIIRQAPTEKDLRCLSAFMQLVRDLERIGDYAKDLAKIAIKLFPYPQHSSLPEIAIMSQHAQAMLATCLVALADLDETSGQRMKQLDDAVDNAYEHLYQTFAQQENFPGVMEPILLLTLAIRCLERMADHATNIAQRVTYIVTGQRS
ncbi:MAG: phosphate signaling complex protein PhoU [Aphanizomenon gracile PMC638.10]|nr:phosphate signaling complex protein PhoU [Aphanizomenon gracile PMC638.10]